MTSEIQNLPLFTLPLVALPGEVIPLHIFEPRYRQLMAWCLAGQEAGRPGEFVISVSQGEDRPAPVGTVVRLIRVLHRHEDGRLDVLVVGRRRIRINRVRSDQAYYTVDVAPWEDTRPDWEETLATEAYQLHSRLMQAVSGQEPEAASYAGHTSLAFYLAGTFGLRVAERQSLLLMQDEDARLRFLVDHGQRLLEQAAWVQAAWQSIQQGLEAQALLARKNPGG